MLEVALIVNANRPSGPVNVASDIYKSIVGIVDVKIYAIGKSSTSFSYFQKPGLVSILYTIIKNKKIIIHTHGIRPDMIGYACKKILKRRWISTLHTYIEDDFKYNYKSHYKYYGILWKQVLKSADCLAVLNEYICKKYVGQGFGNIKLIPNGRCSKSVLYFKKLEPKIKLGYIGNLIDLKNVLVLPDALEGLNVSLKIAGDGYLQEELQRKLTDKKIQFEMLGRLAEPRMLYDQIDILLLPSKTEASPLVLLEAACHAIPCLMNKIPHLVGTFEGFGQYVERWEPIEIAVKLEEFRQNYNLWQKKVHSLWLKNFTLEVMVDRYLLEYMKYE